MKEELLYFVWKFKLYNILSIHDNNQSDLQVLSPGNQNTDAGPDFTEAKIKSENTIWVGNVEIHLKSSDWYKHGHQLDKAYNSVILQVVVNHDKEVKTENGRLLPVIEIEPNPDVEQKYLQFISNKLFIPCAKDINVVDKFKIEMWLAKVLTERLIDKTLHIQNILSENKNNWEECFYQLIARSFGFKINAEPFEWLAKSIPLKILVKHHNNLNHLEALLFGQAGFLDNQGIDCEYYKVLKQNYQFLKNKYQLKPFENYVWKFLRIRPSNFPTIRIAQFAQLVHKSNSLFSKIIHAEHLNEIKSFLMVDASEYWDNHYYFNKTSNIKKKAMGEQSRDSLIINTIVPIIFIYGKITGDEKLREKAVHLLENLAPEKNKILVEWRKLGVRVSSAFYSQALLHQKKLYCAHTRCLECGIGIEILKKTHQNQ